MNSSAASFPSGVPLPAGDSPEASPKFRYWQTRTLVGAIFGYAAFYFIRKNLSVAMPAMQDDLHLAKSQLGLFLTAHGVLYGISKFANGPLGDRLNARYFLVAGLLLSVACNVFFGLSSTVTMLGIAWTLNGWVQGMGFPPCCRLITHWFPPQKLATKMSIWNTSHSIGAWATVIACGYLVSFGWRWCFLAPAALCAIAAVILFFVLRDTPSSVGLPEIGEPKAAKAQGDDETSSADYRAFLRRRVFGNPHIWLIAIANFFVYVMRFAILDWGPTLLKEAKGFSLQNAGWLVAGFEASGLVGMLLAGWLTDRVFGGRGSRTCVFCMIGAVAALFAFWKVPAQSVGTSALLLGAAGFFIYGPQALVGIIVANLATKRAAATAVGFTGFFGYLSTIVSGWGLGLLVQRSGWNAAFGALLGIGAIGTFLFLLAWPAKAHGYEQTAA
jgi:OPA family glycerol-3-phosphate transporter-like MFS transporter/OPA family sugar phosphate sensor protein UhpC-like MFS transporter